MENWALMDGQINRRLKIIQETDNVDGEPDGRKIRAQQTVLAPTPSHIFKPILHDLIRKKILHDRNKPLLLQKFFLPAKSDSLIPPICFWSLVLVRKDPKTPCGNALLSQPRYPVDPCLRRLRAASVTIFRWRLVSADPSQAISTGKMQITTPPPVLSILCVWAMIWFFIVYVVSALNPYFITVIRIFFSVRLIWNQDVHLVIIQDPRCRQCLQMIDLI